MRKVFLFLIIFSLHSTALWASDPLIGKWKLNVEKSRLGVIGENMKESIEVYREIENNMIELSSTELSKDGSTDSSKWTWPKEGGYAKVLSRTLEEGIIYVQTHIDSGHWCVNIMKDGKQIARYHKIVSKDGKTMKQSLIGSRNGKPIKVIKLLERQ